jgi:hypothetical protein
VGTNLTYAKQKNGATAKAAPDGAGDTWTWMGLDADTKLIVQWFVGARDGYTAKLFIDDLASRHANRVQLTSDGLRAYLESVEGGFGATPCWSNFKLRHYPIPQTAVPQTAVPQTSMPAAIGSQLLFASAPGGVRALEATRRAG